MQFARALLFFVSLLSLFLIWRQARLFAPLFLILSSPFWLLDASQVRSDLFALPFLLLFFSECFRQPKRFSWLLIAATLSVLVTPKSFFFLIAAIPLLEFRRPNRPALAALVFAALFLLAWGTSQGLFAYYLRLFDHQEYGASLLSPLRFQFVFRFFIENPAFIAILLFAAFSSSLPKKRRISLGILWASILIFPDKLPFFLATGAVLSIALALPLFRMMTRPTLGICFALAILSQLMWSFSELRHNSSREQRQLITFVEDLKTRLGPFLILDGLGLFAEPNRGSAPFFWGPAENDLNQSNSSRIQDHNWMVLLISHRLALLGNLESSWLETNFLEISEGVWVRKLVFSGQETHASIVARARSAFLPIWKPGLRLLLQSPPLADGSHHELEVPLADFIMKNNWKPGSSFTLLPLAELSKLNAYSSPQQLLRFESNHRFRVIR